MIGVVLPLVLVVGIFFVAEKTDGSEDDKEYDVRKDKIWMILTFVISLITVIVTIVAAGTYTVISNVGTIRDSPGKL